MQDTCSIFRPLLLTASLAVGGVLGMGQVHAQTLPQDAPSASQTAAETAPKKAPPPPGVIIDGKLPDRTEKRSEVFDRVDVVEYRGNKLPLGLIFTDDQGQEVKLGDYLKPGRPVILNLGYYQCPMLCDLVMNGLNKSMKNMGWMPGDQYQVISVSIDPTENHKLAAAKKKAYIDDLGYDAARTGWHFLTGDQDNISMLAQSVGFKYEWVQQQQEYAHPAVIMVITADGTISRYLYGVEFPAQTLRLSLVEASEGKVGSALDKLILTCFHYDPKTGGYTPSVMRIMRLGGVLTVLAVAGVIGTLLMRERARREQLRTNDPKISASA